MTKPKRIKRDVSGWLVLDKPLGMTSTQAVGKVRWLFSAKKAGHAGTLDPLATGILPIALGEATKTVPHIQDGTKIYRFAVTWGVATATADAEGAVTATSDIRPGEAAILAVLPNFVGNILQTPPAYSAIKIGGERAYDLARAGEDVELAPRAVQIASLTLQAHTDGTRSEFELTCGKGTYVRSLAVDLATVLGTVGHVSMLRRTAVGPFHEAVTLDALEAANDRDLLLKPVAAGLAGVPELRLDPTQAAAIRHGNAVLLTGAGAPVTLADAWASYAGQALAIGTVAQGRFHPHRVLI